MVTEGSDNAVGGVWNDAKATHAVLDPLELLASGYSESPHDLGGQGRYDGGALSAGLTSERGHIDAIEWHYCVTHNMPLELHC